MNLSRIIADAIQGRVPRRHDNKPAGATSTLSPQEFLRAEVWPLFRETRQALDSRGITAVALQPAAGDPAHSFTLLVLDSRRESEDACFLRFLVHNSQLHIRVKHSRRSDEHPVPLHPTGTTVAVRSILADFLYQCLTPAEMERQPPPHAERDGEEERDRLCRVPEFSAAQ